MPTYRRGFKTEVNQLSKELRQELKLHAEAPLSPWKLADHLSIPLIRLSDHRQRIPDEVAFFEGEGRKDFSAATVFCGTKRAIIYNDSHHRSRQASDIAHELAHGLLQHPPAPPLSDEGCRNFDAALEAEANWLGPALLVSEEAAMSIARRGISVTEAAEEYEVSTKIIQMRLNVTAAGIRVARRRRVSS